MPDQVTQDNPTVVVEICVESMDEALAAVEGGCDRLELCAARDLGGTTPSVGLQKLAREQTDIELVALIRSRPGDFCYSPNEIRVMSEDICRAADSGMDGVAIGPLRKNGDIDTEACAAFIDLARPMSITFHRAFDLTSRPESALALLAQLGINRLLTSGQAPSAIEGRSLISNLVSAAEDRIEIIAAGGITSDRVASLIDRTGVRAIHASARGIATEYDPVAPVETGLESQFGIFGKGCRPRTNAAEVRAIIRALGRR